MKTKVINPMIVLLVAMLFVMAGCSGGSNNSSPVTPPSGTPSGTETGITSGSETIVQPSNNDQTIDASGVSVVIPGGLLSTSATLTVKPSNTAAQLPKPSTEMQMLGSYDISLGNSSTFDKNIKLELPYDPATLDSSLPEGKNIWVTSWSTQDNHWTMQRAEVDTVRKRIIVSTNHLSTWAFWKMKGYKYVTSLNGVFDVYYLPDAKMPRIDIGSDDYKMIDLATDASIALSIAYENYQDKEKGGGFRKPTGILSDKINAIITDWGSSMGGYTGNIYLDRGSLNTMEELRSHCGHELFHVFQNEYFNILGMDLRFWWIEGTPDYAASIIAWNGTLQLPTFHNNYFSNSLLYYADSGEHAYMNSYFISYLVNIRNLNFKAMWDAVATNSSYADNGLDAFKAYVLQGTGQPFNQVWLDFVEYTFFNPNSQMKTLLTTDMLVTDKDTGKSVDVAVPAGYSAKIVLIIAESSVSQTLPITISVSDFSAGSRVQIYSTNNNRNSAVFQETLNSGQTSKVPYDLGENDALYAVVQNVGDTDQIVTIKANTKVDSPPSSSAKIRCENGLLPTCTWWQSGLNLYCPGPTSDGVFACKIDTVWYTSN